MIGVRSLGVLVDQEGFIHEVDLSREAFLIKLCLQCSSYTYGNTIHHEHRRNAKANRRYIDEPCGPLRCDPSLDRSRDNLSQHVQGPEDQELADKHEKFEYLSVSSLDLGDLVRLEYLRILVN